MTLEIEQAILHAKNVGNTTCGECRVEHLQLAKWLEELVELRKWNKKHESEINVLKASKQILINDRDRLVKQRDTLIKNEEVLADKIEQLKTDIRGMGYARAILIERIERNTKEKLTEDRDNLRDKIKVMRSDLEDYKTAAWDHLDERDRMREKRDKLQKDLDTTVRLNEILNHSLEAAFMERDEAQKKYRNLESNGVTTPLKEPHECPEIEVNRIHWGGGSYTKVHSDDGSTSTDITTRLVGIIERLIK